MTIPEIAELRARLCKLTEALGRVSGHAGRVEEIRTDHAGDGARLEVGDLAEIASNTREAYLELVELSGLASDLAQWVRPISARMYPEEAIEEVMHHERGL